MASRRMTKEEQAYEELRKAMNKALFRAPRSPSVMRLLKFFFPTVEDAEIGSYVEYPMGGGRPKTAERIAEESGKDVKRVEEVLDRLFLRGGIQRLELPGTPSVKLYFHLGTMGMSDILGTVGKDDTTDPAGITYREVVNQYYDEGYLTEWGPSQYPAFRTLVVDQTVDAEAKVLPWELASEVVKAQQSVAIAYCNCRIRHRKCNHKIDCCFLFGPYAEPFVQLSKVLPGARPVNYVSHEEALRVLEECFKEGLVASTMNNADPTQAAFMCMCCSCCCHILGGYAWNITGWGNPGQLMKSNLQPRRDEEKCRRCTICVKRCPVNALWRHWPHEPDLSDDFIFFEADRCIGCGICAFGCPNDALTMVKVREFTPEPDSPSAYERQLRERRH